MASADKPSGHLANRLMLKRIYFRLNFQSQSVTTAMQLDLSLKSDDQRQNLIQFQIVVHEIADCLLEVGLFPDCCKNIETI